MVFPRGPGFPFFAVVSGDVNKISHGSGQSFMANVANTSSFKK